MQEVAGIGLGTYDVCLAGNGDTKQATSNALAEFGIIGQAMTHFANMSSGEIEDSLHGEPPAVLMNRVTNVCSEKKRLGMLVSLPPLRVCAVARALSSAVHIC